MLTGDTGRG